MQPQTRKIIIALFLAAHLAACTSDQSSNANLTNQPAAASANSNAVKNDVDELEMIIKLPFHPEDADWREAVRVIFGIDPASEPERARTIYDTHLARARWMTEMGYRHYLTPRQA